MKDNPYKAPNSGPSERTASSAIDTAWTCFLAICFVVLVLPMVFLPDENKAPSSKAMLELSLTLLFWGIMLLVALLIPLIVWTWRSRCRGRRFRGGLPKSD